jgi:prevent-host-death family protein
MATWQLQTAKAKLSELLRAVREHGPQVISVRGKEEYLVIPNPQVEAAAPTTGLDLFRPVLGLGVDLELPPRDPEGHRKLWFEDPDLTDEDFAGLTKPR